MDKHPAMTILSEFKYMEPLNDIFYKQPYKNSAIRRAKLILIGGTMTNYEGFRTIPQDRQVELLTNVEKSCFNSAIIKSTEKNFTPTWKSDQFCNIYNAICYRVLESLDAKSELNSSFLIKWVLKNPDCVEEIGLMTAEELCPYNNVEIRKKIRLRLQQEIELKTTSIYTCENCGKDEVIIKRKQLRSQDEGASTICVCKYCNNRWIYW